MRVAIVGAGIVGITSAYELAASGHQVQVFERHSSVAAEASFGHAGLIGADHLMLPPLGGADDPRWRHLGAHAEGLRWVGTAALRHAPWLWQRWRSGRAAVHGAHRQAMQSLAQFSRDRLLALTRTLQLGHEQTPGLLVLLRNARETQKARQALKPLIDSGLSFELVDATRCRQIEPALHADTALHAGIFWPHDGVGNCRLFAHQLKAQAQALGAHFQFDTAVQQVLPGARPAVKTADQQRHEFDAVVLCTGARARLLLMDLSLRLPLLSVSGYSVTAPLRHLEGLPPLAPRSAVIDQGVVISRLGQRVRVSGGAELGGYAGRIDAATLRRLYRVLNDWFPGAALTHQAQHWKGARPTLPDGLPVLGASGAPGVWLNLGHGATGWAMACGSALVLAEMLAGRAAPLDMLGLRLARFR